MDFETKKRFLAELLHIADETRKFDPPYIPSRYIQDVADSDPVELVYKYVLAKQMTDGYKRPWEERRLDLAVENVAWQFRRNFPPEVGRSARTRLDASGFDVVKQ